MRFLFLLFLSLVLTSATYGEEREHSSIHKIELAKKQLLANLAPLLPGALTETGMGSEEASAFCKERQFRHILVEGGVAQTEYNYQQAQEILSSLPQQCRNEFMRLTYQWAGPSSLWRDEIAQKLGLTQEQRDKVQTVYLDFEEQLAPVNRADFRYDMSHEEKLQYDRRTQEIEHKRDNALLAILSQSQFDAWKVLIGKPSKALQEFRDYCARYN